MFIFYFKIIGKNKVEITVTPRKGIEEEPFQCENRLGYWDAISTAFNYKFPKIEHPECIFQGGSSCRYIVSWQESRYIYWKKIRNFMGVLLLLICLVSPYIISNFITLTTVLPLSIAVFSFLGWYTSLINEQELNRAVEILRDSSDELVEQINVNYERLIVPHLALNIVLGYNPLPGRLVFIPNDNPIEYAPYFYFGCEFKDYFLYDHLQGPYFSLGTAASFSETLLTYQDITIDYDSSVSLYLFGMFGWKYIIKGSNIFIDGSIGPDGVFPTRFSLVDTDRVTHNGFGPLMPNFSLTIGYIF